MYESFTSGPTSAGVGQQLAAHHSQAAHHHHHHHHHQPHPNHLHLQQASNQSSSSTAGAAAAVAVATAAAAAASVSECHPSSSVAAAAAAASSFLGALDIQAAGDADQQLYVNLSTFWYSFLALITTVGLLISLISNMIIIYLFTSTPLLRKNPSNIIAVNLSLSDLLYCVQWPSVIYCSLTQSTWILEHTIVCQSFGFITVSTALASILTVLAMSIERAIVIIYSVHAKNKFTIRSAWLIIVLIWLVSLSSCLPPLFGKFNRYTLDPSKTSCTLDYLSRQANYKLYILVLYVAYWIVPTVLISISYITIIVTFKKSSLDLKKIASEEQPPGDQSALPPASIIPSSSLSSSSSSHFRRRNSNFRAQLRDSLRSKLLLRSAAVSHSNPSSAAPLTPPPPPRNRSDNHLNNGLLRASSSVFELNCVSRNLSSNHRSNGPSANAHDDGANIVAARRPTFKRVVSSSALLVRSVHTAAAAAVVAGAAAAGITTAPPSSSQNNLKQSQQTIINNRSATTFELDRWRSNLTTKLRGNSTVAFKPRIIKTLSNIRLAKMSFYLILLWLVSWTPIASLAMINAVMSCHRASATAVFLASTMTKLGPALDVFIYGISHPKIKCRFKQIIRRLMFLEFGCGFTRVPSGSSEC